MGLKVEGIGERIQDWTLKLGKAYVRYYYIPLY